jgi:DnaJ-class molecular chaperone
MVDEAKCWDCKGTGVFDRIDVWTIPCSLCDGQGTAPEWEYCDDCDGNGSVTVDNANDDPAEQDYREWTETCSTCGGAGAVQLTREGE